MKTKICAKQLALMLKKSLAFFLLAVAFTSLHAQTFTIGSAPDSDFSTLSAAVSSSTVPAGSTLEILETQICNNIIISKNLIIRKSPAVTGDIVLSNSGTSRHFTIFTNTSVIFENLIFQGPNTTSETVTGGGIVATTANSAITLTNCKITDCRAVTGGAVSFSAATQTVTLNNTEIRNCSATGSGGGIHCTGTLTIDNSTIANNTAVSSGGGVYATGALTLNNVTVTGNKAGWNGSIYTGTNLYGGGVYASGNLFLQGNINISNNGTRTSGGGIYKATASAPFDVSGLTTLKVNNNLANSAAGGGIYTTAELDFSTAANLETIEIKNDTATSTGGGIYAAVNLILTKAIVSENFAKTTGGGIHAASSLTAIGSTISDNAATQHGGGIYAAGALTLNNVTASGNKAGWTSSGAYSGGYHGGGVYANSNLTLQEVIDINNNGTSNSGGGIYKATATAAFDVTALTTLKVNNNLANSAAGGGIYTTTTLDFSTAANLETIEIKNDTAATTGGGIYAAVNLVLTKATVSKNSAKTTGGGIHAASSLTVTESTISDNTATQHGGGVYAVGALALNNVTALGNKAGWTPTGYSGTYYGGGIYANNNLTLQGAVNINNNGTSTSGGGIYKTTPAAPFDVSNLTSLKVNNNVARGTSGGGIYTATILDFTTATNLSSVEINNNEAATHGGGIYANVLLGLKNISVSGNKAGYNGSIYTVANNLGGGVYANNRLILAGNVTINGNTTGNSGGGIYKSAIDSILTADLTSFTVDGNEAKNMSNGGLGGGIYTISPTILTTGIININNNKAKVSGGGIYTTGTLTLGNATISGNTAETTNGGGIYTTNTIFATNVRITGNNAALQGGGVYLSTQGLTIFNSSVSDNKAGKQGGGIYTSTTGQNNYVTGFNLTLSGNKAGWDFANDTHSSAAYDGGGIYASGPLAFNDALTITNNTATGNGGGIYKGTSFIGLDVAEVKMLTLTGNHSIQGNGGGIYSAYEMLFTKQEEGVETRAVISDNKAGGSGGAIYTTKDLYLTFTNDLSSITISNNNAGQTGGAIYVNGGSFTLGKATVSGNSATGSGGAVYMGNSKIMTIVKSTFANNNSESLGGAIYSTSSNTSQEIANCTFSGNRAATSGGAIAFGAGGASIYYCTLNGNSTAGNHSNAIYWNAGALHLNGNIIYGNGTGTDSEIYANGTPNASYNIIREQELIGANNQRIEAYQGATIFDVVDAGNSDLAILANNQGHTQTIMIKEIGLATGAIPLSVGATFGGNGSTDQRDINRLTTNAVDIGAVQITKAALCERTNFDPIVWYVDKDATSGDGMDDIDHPATDLAAVLNNPCLMVGDTIKITSGTYYSTNTDPNNTFMLKKGVYILGGYTSDFSDAGRDFKKYPTILDGNAKSYHVLSLFTGVDEPSQIDGIVIQNGKALGASTSQTYGGGIYFYTGKLLLSNSIIKNNESLERGGGIYVAPNGTALTVRNSSFTGNKSGHNGTSIVSVTTTTKDPSAAELMNSSGGAICAEGNLELQGNLYFDNNESGGNGGSIIKGVQNEFITTHLDTLVITNSTAHVIDGSSESSGGGNWGGGGIYTMMNLDLSVVKKIKIHNSIAESGQGGGIYTNNKTIGRLILRVTNGDFYNCRAQGIIGDGGAIESYGTTSSLVILKDCSFDTCYATRYGGALGIGNVLKLEGSIKINNSTANTNGAGITHWAGPKGFPELDEFDVRQCDTLIVTNCKTTRTSGTVGGGGIWINQSELDLSPVKYVRVEGNTSAVEGGGIKFASAKKLTLGNAIIKGNKSGTADGTAFSSTYKGGGIYTTGIIEVKAGAKIIVDGNMSSGDGGGIYAGSTFRANQADSLVFSNNEAGKATAGNGGGLYSAGACDITNATIIKNKAKTNGGGIYSTSSFTIKKSTFSQNAVTSTTTGGGGGIYATGKLNRIISNSTFSGNTAASDNGGGAIFSATSGDAVQIALSTFTGNTTKNNQAAAFYFFDKVGKLLNGNIIYGNGSGDTSTEMNILPATANYNIVRNLNLGATNKMLADGQLSSVFETGALADNGGKTPTIMIKKGGPAHNYIPQSVVNSWTSFDALGTDQRDIDRPVGCNEEVGAVEINNEDIPVITFTVPEICYGSETNLKNFITSATNVRDTLFFSNAAYTTPIENPTAYKATQDTVYVRFNTTSNCVINTKMALTINPLPKTPVITNSAFCISGTVADLLRRITLDSRDGVANCYDAEDSSAPLDSLTTALVNGNIYWVSQTNNKACESPRIPVTVVLQQDPVVSLISNRYTLCNAVDFTLTSNITNTDWISYYRWEILVPGSSPETYAAGNLGQFSPAGEDNNGVNAVPKVIYTPIQNDFDNNGKAVIRLRANTGACSYRFQTVDLYKNPSNPAASISIVKQPVTPQAACNDTAYIVKIKETGIGGLSNIRVTLLDWKISGLVVNGADYRMRDTDNWINLGDPLPVTDPLIHTYTLPVTLDNGDSLQVRFRVKPVCGFYGGSSVKFEVNGSDICRTNPIQTQSVESLPFHLNFENGMDTDYIFLESSIDKSYINNSTENKTIKWTATYKLTRGAYDNVRDSLYFLIPFGMNLKPESFDGVYAGQEPRISDPNVKGLGVEYAFPLVTRNLGDEATFSFEFDVTTAASCGDQTFYMEIIRSGKLSCEGTLCTFSESLAQSYPELKVEWYIFDFVFDEKGLTSKGEINNGYWTGSFDIYTETAVPAGTEIQFDFYSDKNGNSYRDEDGTGSQQKAILTYIPSETIPAKSTFHVVMNDSIKVDFDNNGNPYQLLAHIPQESIVCKTLSVPIVTIAGSQSVCQGDTLLYITTPGQGGEYFFKVDGTTGATPKRISNEGNGTEWEKDTVQSKALVLIGNKDFKITSTYRVRNNTLLLNQTEMQVKVTPKAVLETTVPSTSICDGSSIDLDQFIYDSANANPDTWYYYEKQSDGSYSLLKNVTDGIVTPALTTTYGIAASKGSACQSAIIDFTVIVKELPKGTISGSKNVCYGNAETYSAEISNFENTEGFYYTWTVSGTTNAIYGSNEAPDVTVMWNEPGELKVVYTTSLECSNETSLPVTIEKPEIIDLDVTEQNLCDPDRQTSITFSAPGVNASWKYSITVSGIDVRKNNNIDDGEYKPIPAEAIHEDHVSLLWNALKTGKRSYRISIMNPKGCIASAEFVTVFYPLRSTWIVEGEDGDWNNPANWDNGVPWECTYVIIPGNANHYPTLIGETNAICDTIEFGFGGEIARTDLLTYSTAKVNLKIKTMQWYGLSAPLRDMYTGDYMFKQANPLTEIRLHNAINPETKAGASSSDWTTPFNNTNYLLTAGLGYSINVGRLFYTGEFGDNGIDQQNSPWEFVNDVSFVFHSANPPTTFQFYDEITKAKFPKTETVASRENASRFVYEVTENGKSVAPAGDVLAEVPTKQTTGGNPVLVGNPLMAHIDFNEFYYVNKAVIKPEFKVLFSGNSYITLSGTDADNDGIVEKWEYTGNTLPPLTPTSLPPMQSFIVTTREDYTGSPENLSITKQMAVANSLSKLRSSVSEEGIIRLYADNGTYQSDAAIVLGKDFRKNYFIDEDSRRMLIVKVGTAPSIYTVVDGMYLDINRVPELPETLPIGISTTKKGQLTLRLSGLEQVISQGNLLYFKDQKESLTIPLENNDFSYSFNNTEGNQEGRFYLICSKVITSGENPEMQKPIVISLYRDKIQVTSLDNSELLNVSMYGIDGRLLYQQKNTGLSSIELPLPSVGAIVVKASTSKASETSKFMIKK